MEWNKVLLFSLLVKGTSWCILHLWLIYKTKRRGRNDINQWLGSQIHRYNCLTSDWKPWTSRNKLQKESLLFLTVTAKNFKQFLDSAAAWTSIKTRNKGQAIYQKGLLTKGKGKKMHTQGRREKTTEQKLIAWAQANSFKGYVSENNKRLLFLLKTSERFVHQHPLHLPDKNWMLTLRQLPTIDRIHNGG